jgi:nucleoid DNA-binding protein
MTTATESTTTETTTDDKFDFIREFRDMCVADGDSSMSLAEARKLRECFVATIEKGLKEAAEVQVYGLGKFTVNDRSERVGRNPRTGEYVHVQASKQLGFRGAKQMKEAVKNG